MASRRIIPTHPCLQPIHFQSQKANDPELRLLHPTALLMNPPSLFLQLLSLLLRHLQLIGRPVFRAPVLGRNTRTSPMHPPSLIATSRMIRQTVALLKPAEGGDELSAHTQNELSAASLETWSSRLGACQKVTGNEGLPLRPEQTRDPCD